jgi:NADPH:quinone reductase-like Zn-dependent oxidoreductase
MRAEMIRQFGPPSVIITAEVARPEPQEREVLVRIKAAGVGPWDALVREGLSATAPALPLILGSDLAGVVGAVGAGVSTLKPGDEVFGVANAQFTGGYAEFASAPAAMLARKPSNLDFVSLRRSPSSPSPPGKCFSSTDAPPQVRKFSFTEQQEASAHSPFSWPKMPG